MKIKIVKTNNCYNWEGYDKFKIGIYGKTFESKKETKKDVKRYTTENNIKHWHYENIMEVVWNRIKMLFKK